MGLRGNLSSRILIIRELKILVIGAVLKGNLDVNFKLGIKKLRKHTFSKVLAFIIKSSNHSFKK
jgi:hypothetical protein